MLAGGLHPARTGWRYPDDTFSAVENLDLLGLVFPAGALSYSVSGPVKGRWNHEETLHTCRIRRQRSGVIGM